MLHALLNVILGIGSVFIVLILISLVIYSFNIIPVIEKKFQKKPEGKQETSSIQNASPVFMPEDESEDEAVIAAIMAAITAYSGMSQDGFVVRSIVRR